MEKKSTEEGEASRVCYQTLEQWARERIQERLQGLLEEEVEELLGREKWQRKAGVDAAEGYRKVTGRPGG